VEQSTYSYGKKFSYQIF